MKEIYEDPERLRRPLRKKADGTWEEIDWDTALDYAAERLKAIKAAHGANANGFYIGNPTGHNVGGQLYLPALLNALGTQRSFSAGTMDQFPQNVALHNMLGRPGCSRSRTSSGRNSSSAWAATRSSPRAA
jgi:anaerobic selenocysteine-containing dehydrogenase